MVEDIQVELQAIKTLQETLQPLAPEVRTRVLDYVFRVLGISAAQPTPEPHAKPISTEGSAVSPSPVVRPRLEGPTDILTLKEEKAPTTGTQMIAVVAYYLAYLAPEGERQDFITAEDIQRYFIQGKYPMPGSQSQALVNAKNAGYLDFIEKGRYRLNSVGYNLVAHKMPAGAAAAPKLSGNRRKKKAAKKAKK